MSEEDEESRTELSGKRLGEAWNEGNIPLGHDAPLVLSLAFGAAALLMMGPSLRAGLVHAVADAVGALAATPFRALPQLALLPAGAAAVICVAAAAGSVLVTLAQTKGTLWPDRWLPDLSRLFNPSRALTMFQPFNRKTLLDLGMATVKVVALGWAAWSSVHGDFLTLPGFLGATPADQLSWTFRIILRAGWRMLLVGIVIAGADLALVHWRFRKQMRVTKQEAKREAKDADGDPLIKGKRRKKHRELARGRARIEVPRADALLVNPTHIAIALRYRRDEGRAPRVIAKGKGALAEYMRDLARENAIPIVQDIPLARLLYRKVKVGREVPASTYKAVAAVLAFVYRITGRAPGAGAGA
jgi:flagellar biosynthesis protein FlhB